jgi:tetratricopeptide (TPR) repeat protein
MAGRHKEAVEACSAAVALAPNDPDAHCNLGTALSNSKRHEHAIASFRRALELKPQWLQAQLAEAEDLHALGRHREAVTAWGLPSRPTDG